MIVGATTWAPWPRSPRSLIGVVCFVGCSAAPDAERAVSVPLYDWISIGRWHIDVGLLVDQLSIVFVLLITGVGGLIHVYSIGYMAHDERRRRFFAFLNLFVAAMLLLVLGRQLSGAVRRLGGRGPRLVPADRLLAAQADSGDCCQEGFRGQPGR